ncbi:MAG: Trk system potassium transporter TrkA [Lachnospiraceae bacterium]|nr:Trk system potassium transporter TrkA [Lachnospiraceae bacterium]
MQIIIVGCGTVGRALMAQLSIEDNNITVVDVNADMIKNVANLYDVMGIVGNGTSYHVLADANIEHADILIAVTHSDEVNLLCCVVAKKAANCHTIARIRNPVYSEEREFIRRELGLSMTINPEYAAAQEIARLLKFPSAIDIDSFSKGRIELLRFKVPKNSMLIGKALKNLPRQIQLDILVCAVERNNKVFIPDGDFWIQTGDILSIIAVPENANLFFRKIGIRINQVKNALIFGGSEITYYLTVILLSMGVQVKIIEQNRNRCEELSELLPKATIICGDGNEQNLLNEEHLEQMDAMVASTDMDEKNIILSLYAQGKVKSKIITQINHLDFNDVIHNLNLDSLIYPKNITAEYILQYVRAMKNSIGSNVERLYKLMDGRVEALEFIINPLSGLIGIKLQDMKLKSNLLIAGIGRKGKFIIPGGQDEFQSGDSIIVVTTNSGFQDIYDILKK